MAETARKGKKMPKSKEQHLAELPKKKFKIMNLRSLSFGKCNQYAH